VRETVLKQEYSIEMANKKPNCSWWTLATKTYDEWSEDRALRFSAALAYYAVFSITPLLIIAIAVAGFLFGEQAARGEILQQLTNLLGEKAAAEIQGLIQAASNKPKSAIATAVGLLTLIVGASGVFGQLKDALNTIWGVRIKSGTAISDFIRDYLVSFGMVMAVGFLLIVSLVVTTAVQAVTHYMVGAFPMSSLTAPVTELGSFALMSLLFAVIYKVLPDVQLQWHDVWTGAFVTGILFTAGKYLIGLYLATSSVASSFGAAGALILVLVWIYYSTVIFFFGAEFTKVYSRECGRGVKPSKHATFASREMRVEQGVEKTH
jgi:membrane protein